MGYGDDDPWGGVQPGDPEPDPAPTPVPTNPDPTEPDPNRITYGSPAPSIKYDSVNLTGGGAATPSTKQAPSVDARTFLHQLLTGGNDPHEASQRTNQQYGLTTGGEAYYDQARGIVAAPGGGYFSNGPNGWQYAQGDSAGGGGGQRTTYGSNGVQGFADPAYQGLMDLVSQRLRSLSQPQSFPQMDALMAMLKQNEGVARQRAQTFADQLTGRITGLQQPLLTDANVANQRALASNNLQAQRDAALKNQRERRFSSGFEPTSGLIAGDERATNEQYNNAQSNIDAQLQRSSIATDEQRRNQATHLQGLVQQALQGGDVTALQNQAQVSDLENQMFNMDQNRQREALTVGNIPVDLTNMAFSNANNVANSGGDPMSSILSLLSAGNTQQGLQQNNSNNNASTWAWLIQQLLGGRR